MGNDSMWSPETMREDRERHSKRDTQGETPRERHSGRDTHSLMPVRSKSHQTFRGMWKSQEAPKLVL